MIKKLQRRFIVAAMASIIFVMVLVLGSINFINWYRIDGRMDTLLRVIASNNGDFPKYEDSESGKHRLDFWTQLTEETQFQTRYFGVWVNQSGEIVQTDTDNIAAVSQEEAVDYGLRVLQSGKRQGYMGNYRYLSVDKKSFGTLILFLDSREWMETVQFFLMISVGIAAGSLVLVYILIRALSGRAIHPMVENLEKQKRFITDAGHEIKTPLAIISADAEVLELSTGKNEWIDSIRNQTDRLDKLVKSLLTLSKMSEGGQEMVRTDFSISSIVKETVRHFEPVAEMRHKHLETRIQPELKYRGDENSIGQLTAILVDNAVKYCEENGTVLVTLSRQGKLIRLQVENEVEKMPEGNLSRLFDRFYRADASRSRDTGGYGIGLSIAQNIVDVHKGRITARQAERENKIIFTVLL